MIIKTGRDTRVRLNAAANGILMRRCKSHTPSIRRKPIIVHTPASCAHNLLDVQNHAYYTTPNKKEFF